MRIFAACTPGLEPFLDEELASLGLRSDGSGHRERSGAEAAEDSGGLEFQGTLRDLYRANLHLRTASRVLLHAGSFFADTFSDLGRRARRLSWESCLRPGEPVSLRVAVHRSRLFHTGAIAEKVLQAIGDRLGTAPPGREIQGPADDPPGPLVLVRLVENRCTVSLDSSGELLHRRGYRLETGKAPLRETLAAGMLLASGWDRSSPLLDPLCGAGTIAIEAGLLARGIPPGIRRRFAFMGWPNFDSSAWEGVLAEAKPSQRQGSVRILGSDRDAGAIRSAAANAEWAGVAGGIQFSARAISAVDPPPGPGWVVTNPPYGVRLGSKQDLRRLYARLGEVLRAKCPGWRVTLLCGSPDLLRATGLEFEPGIRTRNGGLKVLLVRGRISNRAGGLRPGKRGGGPRPKE